MLRPEVIRIWTLGMEVVDVSEFSSLERGCKIVRAALVADDSNYWVVRKPPKTELAVYLPEGVRPWACPGWREQVRRCIGRHVADQLPRSIVSAEGSPSVYR
jgi:hypothetical protein